MTHINLGVDEQRFPGMAGLAQFRPETAGPLLDLTQTLLRGPNSLPPAERELIASYISLLNECTFTTLTHSAFAAAELEGGMPLVKQVHADLDGAPISAKLRALLRIAAATREGGRLVTGELVSAARAAGATDLEIHDAVLIAAMLSMFTRYVDGLATSAPEDPAIYEMLAGQLISVGYNPSASVS
jgi:uncharacterized peroxidase-related enzyme